MAIVMIVFFVLLIIGVPVAHVVLGAAAIGILAGGNNGILLAQQTVLGMNSYVLLAVPFFIISGDLAAKGQTSQRLVNVINAFLGSIRGGLGIATIFACALFGAITGSSIACVVAIGALMLPKLLEAGYPKTLVLGIITTAGTLGVMIPPSIPMLQVSVAMGTSVAAGFTSGFIPGILTAVFMSIWVFISAKKHNIPKQPPMPWREKFRVLKDSFWALMFPVVILGTIYGGIATPTEAAVISVLYVLFVELAIYRTTSIRELWNTIKASTVSAATLTLTIATAQVFVWFMTTENIPTILYNALTSAISGKYAMLFLLCLLFLIVGCFTNVATVVIILGPIIAPVLEFFSIDFLQFGVLAILLSQIGFVSPPFGLCLFVTMKVAKASMPEVVKGAIPFLIAMALTSILVIFIPGLASWLPNLIYG